MSNPALSAHLPDMELQRVDETLLADIADDVHIASTHPNSGVCHGDNDFCAGGPTAADHEAADKIYDRIQRRDQERSASS